MNLTMRQAFAGLSLLAASQLASAANFSLNQPSWTRGDSGSLYLEWDSFDITNGAGVATAPDIGSNNLTSVTLDDNNDAGLLAGSGNWYGFSGAMDFTLTVAGDANGPATTGPVDVQLQLSLSGDATPFLLNGVEGTSQLLATQTNNFGGQDNHLLVTWTVADASNFVFNFGTNAAHASLDALALDIKTSEVPVPAAAWLFGSALLGLGGVKRKARG